MDLTNHQVLTLLNGYLTTKDIIRLKCTNKEIYSTDALSTNKNIIKFNKFIKSIPKITNSTKAELLVTFYKGVIPSYKLTNNIKKWVM